MLEPNVQLLRLGGAFKGGCNPAKKMSEMLHLVRLESLWPPTSQPYIGIGGHEACQSHSLSPARIFGALAVWSE